MVFGHGAWGPRTADAGARPGQPAVPQIRSVALRPATDFLRRIGAPVDDLLERAHIHPWVARNGEALVPVPALNRFLDEAAHVEAIGDLGVQVGLEASISKLGPLGRAVTCAPTLHEALQAAYRILPRHSSGERAWCTVEGEEAHLHHRWCVGPDRAYSHAAAIVFFLHLDLLRSAAGPGFRPLRVDLQAEPSAAYRRPEALGDTPIRFGREMTTITVPTRLLSLAMPRPAAATSPADWREDGPATDFAGSMQQVVAGLLPAGHPDLPLVARIVGLSVRTAQRRLARAGTTYARLVAAARFDLAQRMFADPRRKIIEVALDLGYSDAAHFTRAFRRWTSTTPRAFRRQRRQSQHPS